VRRREGERGEVPTAVATEPAGREEGDPVRRRATCLSRIILDRLAGLATLLATIDPRSHQTDP
jgi:hypothetical protein